MFADIVCVLQLVPVLYVVIFIFVYISANDKISGCRHS